MAFNISVVIPNYNGKSLLEQNLPFVYNALETSGIKDYEIIISDDASVDDSLNFLKTNYPEIIIIESVANCGFSGNTNQGIFAAQKDLVLILNSDVELTPGYFIPLLSYFEKEDTFGVSGRIIAMDGEKIQDGAKFPEYSYTNIISTKNFISKDTDSLPTLFMSGANALIDRKKLVKMGGFNEMYNPYYSEDVDLGLRAWRLGYQLYYDHRAICKHPNSATIKKESSKKVKIISKRNKMYVHFFHLNGLELHLFMTKTAIKALFRLLVLDFNFYISFQLFLANTTALRKKKREFEKQKNEIQIKSIPEVIQTIESKIKGLEIIEF